MAQIIDSTGREWEAIIAHETVDVVDPASGVVRKVFADQPVPAGLEGPYLEATGGAKKKTRAKKKT